MEFRLWLSRDLMILAILSVDCPRTVSPFSGPIHILPDPSVAIPLTELLGNTDLMECSGSKWMG
jgi:hypothetical protein